MRIVHKRWAQPARRVQNLEGRLGARFRPHVSLNVDEAPRLCLQVKRDLDDGILRLVLAEKRPQDLAGLDRH